MAGNFYSGTTPNKGDTTNTLWMKILTRFGQITGNKAHPADIGLSRRQLIYKTLQTINGK